MCDGNHPHHHHHHHNAPPSSAGLKIAISGKGGVGKTTLTALLARSFAAAGCRVLAIDADPDANLATALGIPLQLAAGITPVAKMKALAEERTGAQGGYGSLFKLNPTVSDLPKQFCVEQEGVRFLWMGTLDQGGSGCACPESTFVRRLMGHLMLERQDVVILDMEAGIEHLGRGTAEAVDALITVVEPGERSLQTAAQIRQLAADIGIRRTFVVGSKLRDAADESFLQSKIAADELLGFLPYHDEIRQADRNGEAPTACGNILAAITTLRQRLQHLTAAQTTFATAS